MRDLRNHTAEVLGAAQRDGGALISNRGRLVARLVPHGADDRSALDEFLEWVGEWDGTDTGWADEFAEAKLADAEAAEPKPWE